MKKYFLIFVALLVLSLTSSLLFLANNNDQVTETLSVNQLSKVQSIFEEISSNQNSEYFDDTIKLNRFDLAFNDGKFVNLSFTILQSGYGRKSKYYQLLNTGELIETDGFELVVSQYITSELVYDFFEAVDNNAFLDVLNIDKTKNINFIYMGKVSLSEEDTQKKDVYIIKSNKLEIFADEHLNLEKEHYFFQVIANNRVIYVAI